MDVNSILSSITSFLPVIVVLAILGISNTIKLIIYTGKSPDYEADWFPLIPLALGLFYGIGEFFLSYTPGSLSGFKLFYSIIKTAFGYGGAAGLLFKLTQPILENLFKPKRGRILTVAQNVLLGKSDNGGAK
jgi:hypothetical protein